MGSDLAFFLGLSKRVKKNKYLWAYTSTISQPVITYSNLTIKTLEQGVKNVPS